MLGEVDTLFTVAKADERPRRNEVSRARLDADPKLTEPDSPAASGCRVPRLRKHFDVLTNPAITVYVLAMSGWSPVGGADAETFERELARELPTGHVLKAVKVHRWPAGQTATTSHSSSGTVGFAWSISPGT